MFLHYHARIVSAVQPLSSLISHRVPPPSPGETVDWFLTPPTFKIMDTWNLTAYHVVYFLVMLLIQTDRFLKIKHKLDKRFSQIKHCNLK